MIQFKPNKINLTKYLFFTGKGGVGKTSIACATAISLADTGKKVLLVSTDPASNLQDVFSTTLTNKGVPIDGIPNLVVANLDPVQAAFDYKESVIAPYRGKLPEVVLKNMEEQLSGSCTVEIAAFNEFTNFITDDEINVTYDHILFDTAPTGHTLRMLQLPSAWSNFISESTHGASCLGQLSGLEAKKIKYKEAVETLADKNKTTLVLVSRPDITPLEEAERSSRELLELGVKNQMLVINGIFESPDDEISKSFYHKQQVALEAIPNELKKLEITYVPLRSYNITGIENLRLLLTENKDSNVKEEIKSKEINNLSVLVDDLIETNKKVIFTMGKGGVGKTTIAAAIAMQLAKIGKSVHLTTTDPAAHLKFVINESSGITMSHIDEKKELERYKNEVLSKARETMSEDDIAYIEEDLKSPCTQEIAVFRAFAEIVERASNEIVVIDTAPTGHTLLLLDSTQSYHKEVKRTQGDIPESVKNLLPRLKSEETEVIIVTLPETTPVYEAMRLEEDLKRAEIATKWWVVNSSMLSTATSNRLLSSKSKNEIPWINKVNQMTQGNMVVIPWKSVEIKNNELLEL